MAAIDDIIAQLVGQKKAAADNTLLDQLNQIKSATNTENTQYQQAKPTFQTERNNADAQAWMDQQATNEKLNAMGNYRGGSAVGAFQNFLNRANSQTQQITDKEKQFDSTHLQRLNDLLDKQNQAQAQKTQAYGLADQEGAAKRAEYQMQQEQAARARSSGGGGSKAPSATQQKASAKAGAYQWVNDLALQGDTLDVARAKLRDFAPQLIEDQVDVNDLEKYMISVFNSPRGTNDYKSSYGYANGATAGTRMMGGYVPQ